MHKIIEEDLERICETALNWGKLKNSRVLITGATGLLGTYMLFTLLRLNALRGAKIKVIALVRDIQKAKQRWGGFYFDPALTVKKAAIDKKVALAGRLDYIIHAASPANSLDFGRDPQSVVQANVLGTYNLLELARKKKVKGFLFFSSGEVYGRLPKKLFKENDRGSLDPLDPRSCYGESKRVAEDMCRVWFEQHGVPALIVRPDHTYGPVMDLDKDNRVFAEFVKDAVLGRDIRLKSDGTPVRTFCYLSDATSGFFRVLLQGKPGQAYNVSNNRCRTSVGKLARLVAGLAPGEKIKVKTAVRRQKGYLENKDKIRPSLSTEKIEKLGYRAQVGLREGFRRCIAALKEKG